MKNLGKHYFSYSFDKHVIYTYIIIFIETKKKTSLYIKTYPNVKGMPFPVWKQFYILLRHGLLGELYSVYSYTKITRQNMSFQITLEVSLSSPFYSFLFGMYLFIPFLYFNFGPHWAMFRAYSCLVPYSGITFVRSWEAFWGAGDQT